MRKSTLLFSGSLMLTCLGALAPAVQAQQGTTLTGNAAMVSDYRYRGISQTRFGPALQVGADLVHGSGAYAAAPLARDCQTNPSSPLTASTSLPRS
ncbi:MAG: hypothetical protein EBZ64_12390 [Betaproteobacteria bacterium]|nr:hypothetical protein [Betaproteobacteria bacterium]